MGFRGPLMVYLGQTRLQWNLGAEIRDILTAIKTCTNRASGWR